MDYLSTRQVASLFGVSVSLLTKAVWCGRVDPPRKSPSGNFLWTPADIDRVSCVLPRKPHGSQKRRRNGNTTRKNTIKRPVMRSKNEAPDRLPETKTRRRRAWLILDWLQNLLWSLYDRAMKAFFDAFFEHLRKP